MDYLVTFMFIVFDCLSGTVMAIKQKSFNSSVMREGLFNKIGEIFLIVLGTAIDYAQVYLDIGYRLPVATAICVYIVAMEITSILENISRINKNLVPEKIREILEKARTKE